MKATRYASYHIEYNLVFVLAKGDFKGSNKAAICRILKSIAYEHEIEVTDVMIYSQGVYMKVLSLPKYTPQLIVNWLKGISAKRFNSPKFPGEGHIKWRRPYCVSTKEIHPQKIIEELSK